jgi:hypothetical protein
MQMGRLLIYFLKALVLGYIISAYYIISTYYFCDNNTDILIQSDQNTYNEYLQNNQTIRSNIPNLTNVGNRTIDLGNSIYIWTWCSFINWINLFIFLVTVTIIEDNLRICGDDSLSCIITSLFVIVSLTSLCLIVSSSDYIRQSDEIEKCNFFLDIYIISTFTFFVMISVVVSVGNCCVFFVRTIKNAFNRRSSDYQFADNHV